MNFKDPGSAILYDSRASNTFKDTIKLSYELEEFGITKNFLEFKYKIWESKYN